MVNTNVYSSLFISKIDLVKVYLSSEVFNLRQAVQVSDRALSSIERSQSNYKALIDVWDEHKNDTRVKKSLIRKQAHPPPPTTSVFLTLFWEPKFCSTQLSRRCMELFGPDIVQNAVSSAIDDAKECFDILCKFDKQVFEKLGPKPPTPKQMPKVPQQVKKQSPPNQTPKAPQPKEQPKTKHDMYTFKRGDRVVIHGLKGHSGKRGVIEKISRKIKKYGVKLDETGVTFAVAPSFLRPDTSDSESESSIEDVSPSTYRRRQSDNTSSSDDDGPPPLNSRDQSSSEDSNSSDDSVPSLLKRGNRSNSSDSSDDDDSSTNSVPPLAKEDNSSDEDIPSLIGPNQQSSSSSDESSLRRQSGNNNPGRGGRHTRRGRGGRGWGSKRQK